MNYFASSAFEVYGLSRKLFAGYVLVSLGMLLAAAGGSWDITNHLLNKPETFFAPPHAVLYSGVSAVVGAVLVFSASKSAGKMIWPMKLVIACVVMLMLRPWTLGGTQHLGLTAYSVHPILCL